MKGVTIPKPLEAKLRAAASDGDKLAGKVVKEMDKALARAIARAERRQAKRWTWARILSEFRKHLGPMLVYPPSPDPGWVSRLCRRMESVNANELSVERVCILASEGRFFGPGPWELGALIYAHQLATRGDGDPAVQPEQRHVAPHKDDAGVVPRDGRRYVHRDNHSRR